MHLDHIPRVLKVSIRKCTLRASGIFKLKNFEHEFARISHKFGFMPSHPSSPKISNVEKKHPKLEKMMRLELAK